MSTGKSIPALAVLLAVTAGALSAQPELEQLRAELERTRQEMAAQKAAFEAQLAELNARLDAIPATDEVYLENLISTQLKRETKFYRRPDVAYDNLLFDALKGGLILTGLFRSRFEYRTNNVDFNDDDEGLDDSGVRFNGRFRLGFGAVMVNEGDTGTVISALTEFQAVGTFANNSYLNLVGPSGSVPLPSAFNILTEPFEEVALYQGYLHFERLLDPHAYIKVGRQELVFGNQFLLGNNEFFDGTVQDALLVEWKQEEFAISAFYAKQAASDNIQSLVSGISDFDEDQFMGLYATVKPDRDVNVDAYALYFDARSPDGFDLFLTGSTAQALDGTLTSVILGHFWTLGARVFWTNIDVFGGTLSVNAEAAYQTGSDKSPIVGDQSLHGWSGEVIVNYRVLDEEWWNPIITLSYYYAGGGDPGDAGFGGFPGFYRHVGFQPLFINRHYLVRVRDRDNLNKPYYPGGGRYGNMDLVPLNNVHLLKAGVSFQPESKTEIGLVYLLAVTADNEGYGTGVFGHEVDFFAAYEYSANITFSANFSIFFPEETAEDLSQLLFFPSAGPGEASDDLALALYIQALIEF